jgi:hypothetical protein
MQEFRAARSFFNSQGAMRPPERGRRYGAMRAVTVCPE